MKLSFRIAVALLNILFHLISVIWAVPYLGITRDVFDEDLVFSYSE